ncbi:MAG: hypothetical protein DHS20C11_02650 [Lysobacteraceae bacterium]|nr:MAG: hypothetical protein DHS20C11_02650 [Xanthomonadaceae bacterium]
MSTLKVINLIAVGGWFILVTVTFFTSSSSDAAGRGMAFGFALVLAGVATVGFLLALINTWATQIVALCVLGLPVVYWGHQQLQGYQWSQQMKAQADGSAYFDESPRRALAAALSQPDLQMLAQLLQAHSELINDTGSGELRLLDIAVDRYYFNRSEAMLQAIDMLLQHGANPNLHAVGAEPLILNNDVIIEMPIFSSMLEHGADPNSVDQQDRTVLWKVVAQFGEETEKVRLLLRSGADPDVSGGGEPPPIAIAARRMHWNNALALIEAGADPHHAEATEFWQHMDYHSRSYEKYRDAPEAFTALRERLKATEPE